MTLKLEVGKGLHMTLPNGDKIYAGEYGKSRNGQKVGPFSISPMMSCIRGSYLHDPEWNTQGGTHRLKNRMTEDDDIVAKWTEPSSSPISTVTKKVITAGTYGNLSIVTSNECGIGVHVGWTYGADNIRQMAALLNEIADVIEENEKCST
jgi:hypothetical protein